jgi:3-dehydroshikimate dehydratase
MTLRLSTLAFGLAVSGLAAAETYVVDRYQDDRKRFTRWAIEQANANPSEASEILIQAVGKAPYAIKVNSPLPEIKAPVKIIGTQWEKQVSLSQLMVQIILKAKVLKPVQANPEQYGTNVRTTTLPGWYYVMSMV